jgi:hypothetical protein
MSRYLERIIAHTKAPVTAVRPLVRPLYAATAAEGPSGPRADVLGAASPAPHGGEAPTGKTPFSPAAPPWQSGEALVSQSDRGSGASRDHDEDFARPRHFATLMPVPGEAADQSAGRFSKRSSDARANLLHGDGEASPAAAASSGETAGPTIRRGESMRERRMEPLMPRQPRANLLPASPLAAAAPSADEIQIHIGRIEITAIPPASAPRPAVRTNPRGVSLDEYLRRGNRRAP